MEFESNQPSFEPQWTDFENRLRAVRPMPCSDSLEDVLAEATAVGPTLSQGLPSMRNAPTRWAGFATGVCSGALAASLVWMLSLAWTREEPIASTSRPSSESQSQALSSPSSAQTVASSPRTNSTSVVPVPPAQSSVPPARSSISALDRWTNDPLRASLNQVAKQQWDQRRLEEHSLWGSPRTIASSQRPKASPIPPRAHSLWGMRGGAMGDASW